MDRAYAGSRRPQSAQVALPSRRSVGNRAAKAKVALCAKAV